MPGRGPLDRRWHRELELSRTQSYGSGREGARACRSTCTRTPFPLTLNTTTGLIYLARRVLLDAEDGGALARGWLDAGLRAGGGQHDDLTPLLTDAAASRANLVQLLQVL